MWNGETYGTSQFLWFAGHCALCAPSYWSRVGIVLLRALSLMQNPLPVGGVQSRQVMLQELLDHVDDCRRSARRYSLPVAPGIDFLDQLGFDPDVDICCFSFHAGEVGRCRAARLMIPAKKLIWRLPTPARAKLAYCHLTRLRTQLRPSGLLGG